jgi:hypothetical protein
MGILKQRFSQTFVIVYYSLIESNLTYRGGIKSGDMRTRLGTRK